MSIVRQTSASFFNSEDGAITVDWVVLVAAIVALGAMATVLIWQQTGQASAKIADFIDGQVVAPAFTSEEITVDEESG